MLNVRRLALTVASLATGGLLFLGGVPPVQAQAACGYQLGFNAIYQQLPAQVGTCKENERHNRASGNTEQLTERGLLVWRKADNWTAFTNGYETWVNGPAGLAKRLNTQRYPFEGDFGSPGTLPVAQPAPAPSAPVAPAPARPLWGVSLVSLNFHPALSDTGNYGRPIYPTRGLYAVPTVTVTNNMSIVTHVRQNDFKITDAQGRTYNLAFVPRMVVDASGVDATDYPLDPGETVRLILQFDVYGTATGMKLHTVGGNTVAL